jgi:hypothetical protein
MQKDFTEITKQQIVELKEVWNNQKSIAFYPRDLKLLQVCVTQNKFQEKDCFVKCGRAERKNSKQS